MYSYKVANTNVELVCNNATKINVGSKGLQRLQYVSTMVPENPIPMCWHFRY